MPTNLTTAAANNAQTAITMLRIRQMVLQITTSRVDQRRLRLAYMNVILVLLTLKKYGLTAGEYSWRIRGACGTNGTSWATIFSQPVTYTLGGAD